MEGAVALKQVGTQGKVKGLLSSLSHLVGTSREVLRENKKQVWLQLTLCWASRH